MDCDLSIKNSNVMTVQNMCVNTKCVEYFHREQSVYFECDRHVVVLLPVGRFHPFIGHEGP